MIYGKGPKGGPQMCRLARTYRELATGTRGPEPLFVVYRQRQSNQGVAVMITCPVAPLWDFAVF